MVIDRKFKLLAVNPCTGNIYTEENAIVLCAKDLAVIPALKAYRDECEKLKADAEQIQSVNMLIARVQVFQNTEETKIPDIEGYCEVDRCIGGVGLTTDK